MKSINSDADHGPALDPSKVDLNKLRTFAVIAEQGGVSAAAKTLSLTRSAVSHSLAALESELELALFHRVGRRLVLTREGEVLRKGWEEMRSGLSRVLGELGEDRETVRGTVRLGAFGGFSRVRLARIAERFLSEHPEARLRMIYGSQAELRRGLLAGRIDFTLSLRATAEAGPRRPRSSALFEQTLVLVAKAKPKGRVGEVSTFTNIPIVDYFRGEPLIDRWLDHHFGRRKRAEVQVRAWVSSSSDLALELVCRGVGACVVPLDLAEPYRRRKELVILRGPGGPLRDDIWLNELDAKTRSPLLTAFREALISGAADQDSGRARNA